MKIDNVNFYTDNHLKISANIYLPDEPINNLSFPAIVLCQGLSGVKNKVMPEVAAEFVEHGFIVLAFDYRGFGESEGDRTRIFPEERVNDIVHAISFIKTYQGVDPDRIGLYGLSYGAAGCIYAAALQSDIKCVVAVSGAVDGIDFMRALRTTDEWIAFKKMVAKDQIDRAKTGKSTLISIKEIVPFTPSFWDKYYKLLNKNESESIPDANSNDLPMFSIESAEAMIHFSLSHIIDKLSPCPILIIHGEVDNVIAIEDVIKIYNQIPGHKNLIILKDKDHIDLDHGPGFDLQVAHALEWFGLYLGDKGFTELHN